MLRVVSVLIVRIQYACDTGQVQLSSSDHELQPAYDVVYTFCEELILNPRVIKFTEIRKLLCDEANKLGIDVPQSHSKNLVRKISSMFKAGATVSFLPAKQGTGISLYVGNAKCYY